MTRLLTILRTIPAEGFFIAVGATATLWFVAAALSTILPGA